MRLTEDEFKQWAKYCLFFLVPVVILYIGYVINNMSDGFEWSDFVPNLLVQGAMVSYVLNEVLAYLKRLKEVNDTK